MYVTIVNVRVKPEHIEDFITACEMNHTASIQETGNYRFDILQQVDEPERFVLYEAYDTEAAAAAHKDTVHYIVWRDLVANWMAEPRSGIVHKGLFPQLS